MPDSGGGAGELSCGAAGERGQHRRDGGEGDADRVDAPEREVETDEQRSTTTDPALTTPRTCQSPQTCMQPETNSHFGPVAPSTLNFSSPLGPVFPQQINLPLI